MKRTHTPSVARRIFGTELIAAPVGRLQAMLSWLCDAFLGGGDREAISQMRRAFAHNYALVPVVASTRRRRGVRRYPR